MYLHNPHIFASDPTRPPRRPPSKPGESDGLGRPEPTEEVDGDEVISDWSYNPSTPPPADRRGTPPHRQRNLKLSPHAF